jgi:hypothetical protein
MPLLLFDSAQKDAKSHNPDFFPVYHIFRVFPTGKYGIAAIPGKAALQLADILQTAAPCPYQILSQYQ